MSEQSKLPDGDITKWDYTQWDYANVMPLSAVTCKTFNQDINTWHCFKEGTMGNQSSKSLFIKYVGILVSSLDSGVPHELITMTAKDLHGKLSSIAGAGHMFIDDNIVMQASIVNRFIGRGRGTLRIRIATKTGQVEWWDDESLIVLMVKLDNIGVTDEIRIAIVSQLADYMMVSEVSNKDTIFDSKNNECDNVATDNKVSENCSVEPNAGGE